MDGQIISAGNTIAVAAAANVNAVNKYIISLPAGTGNRFDFWGFSSTQSWDDPSPP